MMQRLWQGIGAVFLVMLLTACSVSIGGPSQPLVKQAIVLQLQQTQAALNQQLRLDLQPTDLAIKHVVITERTPIAIEDLKAFRVRGTYKATTKLPTRQISEQSPFEVYLQRQKEGKTWRLARLQTDENGEPIWVTQRLQ